MITILFNTLLESAPYVVLGFLIAGIIRIWVPSSILQQHLGRKSRGSLLKSVGIGCVLPLCSCGTIPLGIGLFRSGAAIGNMLAFMTSTPILSPVLVAISFKLLGIKLTVVLLVATVVGAYFIGLIGNQAFNHPDSEKKSDDTLRKFSPVNPVLSQKPKSKLVETFKWSFFELGADVSVDILIGLGIASLLLAVLPIEWVSGWLGQQNMTTLLYVMLLGIPVYACSIPSIPVVQGLLLLGASPGAAVAYLIAGPATNLGELNAIGKSMGMRPALFYATSLVVIALLAGFITDQFVFPDYQYHAFRVQGELVVQQCCVPLIFGDSIGDPSATYAIPVWHWPFGVIFLAVILYGAVKKLRYFFINPCQSCNWKSYTTVGYCGSKCHVRRKYEFLRNFKGI